MIKFTTTANLSNSNAALEEERDAENGGMGYVYLTSLPGGVLEVAAVYIPEGGGEGEGVNDLARIAGWMGWDPNDFEECALAHLEEIAAEAAEFAHADATYDRPRGW